MKTIRLIWPLACGLCYLNAMAAVASEPARFFRIVGPAATTINSISPEGTVTWTSAQTGITVQIQTATGLAPANWLNYVQAPVKDSLTTLRLFDPTPPAGMAFIPGGSFAMGDTLNEGNTNELPVHTVFVSAFYMDRCEVTKALWEDVFQWAITNGYSFEYGAQGKAATHSAQSVTWYDAVKWCNARSEKEGRVPAYYTDGGLTVRYRTGQVTPYVNWSSGYRLPTEAEWEKAARGGATGHRFPWADLDNIGHGRANYDSSSMYSYDVGPTRGYHPAFDEGLYPYTSPAGYFEANGYGLYDTAGNVWEWCWDWAAEDYYTGSPMTNPQGPSTGLQRVSRGGSWYLGFGYTCRVAYRGYGAPDSRGSALGFRTVTR